MGAVPLHGLDPALHDRVTSARRGRAGNPWGHQLATSMLHEAGFGSVEIRDVEDDPVNSYYVCRR